MPDEPASRTTTLLLEGLFDPDNVAVWQAFDERYRPIIIGVGERLGLNHADAADVAQETLIHFLRDYRRGRYDRSRGRLRAWVVGIAKHRVIDFLRARGARRERAGVSSAADKLPEDGRIEAMWDEEVEREIMRRAMTELRQQTRTADKTIEAFEMFVVQRQPAAGVAAALDMTAQDVYMAKKRVAARLRDIIERLRPLYDDTL